jgi:hypothetical protein
MSMLANPYLFTQIGLDSGALTQLGLVAHRFTEVGNYRGVVLLQDEIAANFGLCVDENCAASQVNIDLTLANNGKGSCCNTDVQTYTLHPSGYAIFHIGCGAGGYAATVGRLGQPPVFDSRVLQPGDFFTATILRPGTYVARCKGVPDCRIIAGYPSGRGRVAYKPPAPARVVVGSGRFNSEVLELKPVQPVVFEIQQKARITIELVKPDDGPHKVKPA